MHFVLIVVTVLFFGIGEQPRVKTAMATDMTVEQCRAHADEFAESVASREKAIRMIQVDCVNVDLKDRI